MNKVSIIVAMDEKRGIGKEGTLPFHVPEDSRRVKELTTGHPLVMGRKTFESLGRLLPNRTHIVVTRDPASLNHLSYHPDDAVASVADGIYEAQEEPGSDEIFIFGGGQIYKEALEQGLVDKLYLTIVEGDYGADTFFPEYVDLGFKVTKEESREADGYRYKFVDMEK
jgi:dihydrofolate reductase